MQSTNEQLLADLENKFAGIAADIAISRFDWRALMESCATATIHVSRYRGTMTLTAADLGLDVAEMERAKSVIDLGQRLLLPKDILNRFNSVETRARQDLRAYCLKTPAGLVLPAAAYTACSATIAKHIGRFNDLVAELLSKLPDYETRMLIEYENLAADVARRVGALDSYDFERTFVDRCMKNFPTYAELQTAFVMQLRLEFIPMPYLDGQDAMPQFATATSELVQMRQQVVADRRNARSEIVDGFVQSVQSDLYGVVNTALSDVLRAITDNGALQSRSVVQLRNLVERIGQLNFWQDRTLETIQQEILGMLDRPAAAAGKRDSALDFGIVDALRNQTRIVLSKLGNRGDFEIATEDVPLILLPDPSGNRGKQLDIAQPTMEDIVAAAANRPPLTAEQAAERDSILAKLSGSGNVAITLPDRPVADPAAIEDWANGVIAERERATAAGLVWDGSIGKYVTEQEQLDKAMSDLASIGITFTEDKVTFADRTAADVATAAEYLTEDSIVDGRIVVQRPVASPAAGNRRGNKLF